MNWSSRRVRQVGQEVGRAGEEDGRHLAGAAATPPGWRRSGCPAARLGRTTRIRVCELVRAQRQARRPVLARHGAQRLLGGDDHHRQGQHRQGQRRPDQRRLAADQLRRRRAAGRCPPPTNWMKKPRPKRPKTMEGTPARLCTAMRTSARPARVAAARTRAGRWR